MSVTPGIEQAFRWAVAVADAKAEWNWMHRAAFVVGAFVARTGGGDIGPLLSEFFKTGSLVRGGWALTLTGVSGTARLELQRVC